MTAVPHLPEQVPIDAYGNNGFRFGGMSHQGSLLALPSGMYAWPPTDAAGLGIDDFSQILTNADHIGFVLLGTGNVQIWPTPALRQAFDERQIGLEPMDTGAAIRTYNVLLAEKRPVAAALICVDDPRPR